MKTATANIATLFLCFCAAGCIPYHFTDRPGATGQVVDAATGAPIANAKVDLYRGEWAAAANGRSTKELLLLAHYAPDSSASAVTNEHGQINLPANQRWGLYIIPADYVVFPWRLSVQRSGFETTSSLFVSGPTSKPLENVGRVTLKRLPTVPR